MLCGRNLKQPSEAIFYNRGGDYNGYCSGSQATQTLNHELLSNLLEDRPVPQDLETTDTQKSHVLRNYTMNQANMATYAELASSLEAGDPMLNDVSNIAPTGDRYCKSCGMNGSRQTLEIMLLEQRLWDTTEELEQYKKKFSALEELFIGVIQKFHLQKVSKASLLQNKVNPDLVSGKNVAPVKQYLPNGNGQQPNTFFCASKQPSVEPKIQAKPEKHSNKTKNPKYNCPVGCKFCEEGLSWECASCHNVNYPWRAQCNMRRCRVPKPTHHNHQEVSLKNVKYIPKSVTKRITKLSPKSSNTNSPYNNTGKAVKGGAAQKDTCQMCAAGFSWHCQVCKNVNYGWRKVCNMRTCKQMKQPGHGHSRLGDSMSKSQKVRVSLDQKGKMKQKFEETNSIAPVEKTKKAWQGSYCSRHASHSTKSSSNSFNAEMAENAYSSNLSVKMGASTAASERLPMSLSSFREDCDLESSSFRMGSKKCQNDFRTIREMSTTLSCNGEEHSQSNRNQNNQVKAERMNLIRDELNFYRNLGGVHPIEENFSSSSKFSSNNIDSDMMTSF